VRVAKEHVTYPGQSFRYLRIESAAFRGVRHQHRQLELTWIERGTGMRFVGDNVAPFEAGDLALLGVNLPHLWVSAGSGRAASGGAHAAVATVVQFPPELLEQPSFPELKSAGLLAERARVGLSIHGRCALLTRRLLAAMVGVSATTRLARLIEILGVLASSHAELVPIGAMVAPRPGQRRGERRIDRVVDWIARNAQRRLRIAEVAHLAGVSPAAFSRYFHREVGKAFTVYVNDLRCVEACLRLRRGGKPIAHTAEECGFASLSHFNRQFRRRTGMTPRQYAQALRRSSG
jgi:AraC-like DNA-binding protein